VVGADEPLLIFAFDKHKFCRTKTTFLTHFLAKQMPNHESLSILPVISPLFVEKDKDIVVHGLFNTRVFQHRLLKQANQSLVKNGMNRFQSHQGLSNQTNTKFAPSLPREKCQSSISSSS